MSMIPTNGSANFGDITKDPNQPEGGTPMQIAVGGEEQPDYRPPTFTNMAEDDETAKRAYRRVTDAYEADKTQREPWAKRWTKFYKMYHALTDKIAYSGKANIAVPELYRCVNNIRPRIFESILGMETPFRTMNRNTPDDKQADIMQSVLRSYTENMRLRHKFLGFIDNVTLYGTAFAYLGWRKERNDVITMQTQTIPMLEVADIEQRLPVVENIETYDGPDWHNLDIFDVYIPPYATDLQKCDHVIRVEEVMKHDLDRYADEGWFVNVDEAQPKERADDNSHKTSRDWFYGSSNAEQNTDMKTYQLMHYWGKFDIDDSGREVECWIVKDMGSGKILRAAKNHLWRAFRPFVGARIDPSTSEYYSPGILGPNEKLQVYLNAVTNNTLDAAALGLSPMMIVYGNADVPEHQLVAKPGRVVRAGNAPQGSIVPMTMNSNVGSGQRLMANIQEIMRENTGAIQSVSGLVDPSNSTAQGYSMMLDQGNLRIGLMAKRIEEEAFEPGLNMILALVRQYVTQRKVIRVVGQKGANYVEFDPASIPGDAEYDVKVYGSAMQRERLANSDKIRKYTQTWAQLMPPELQMSLARKDYELTGLTEVEDVFPPDKGIPMQEAVEVIMSGHEVKAAPTDNHMARIQYYSQIIQTPAFQQAAQQNREIAENMQNLIQEHMNYLQQQQAQMQQQAQPAQQPTRGNM